jgi:hypothetical protein
MRFNVSFFNRRRKDKAARAKKTEKKVTQRHRHKWEEN